MRGIWLSLSIFALIGLGIARNTASLNLFRVNEKKEGKVEPLMPFYQSPFFDDPFSDFFHAVQNKFSEMTTSGIPLDAHETKNNFQILCDVPGVKKEDLKVTVQGHRLKLEAHRETYREEEDTTMRKTERSTGDFIRTILLPNSALLTELTAEYRDGVLNVTIPKSVCKNDEEEAMEEPTQMIEIKSF